MIYYNYMDSDIICDKYYDLKFYITFRITYKIRHVPESVWNI